MRWILKYPFRFLLLLVLAGCHSGQDKKAGKGGHISDTIRLSCDESFKPVIDRQVEVFESQNEGFHVLVDYKPEAECLRDFRSPLVQMIIATRGYTEGERKMMADSLNVAADEHIIAHDLIAVIVHPSATDNMFTMDEIRQLVTGKSKENLIPVFDGVRATSTVRFMLDSVLKGQNLGSNVVAAKSSTEVIDYVSKTPKAVGFVGFSWVGNPEDSSQQAYLKRVRTAYVESTDSAGAYITPSQYFLYTKSYPMVRDLVYVVKDRPNGPAFRFARFLESMQGQLIFRRAYLMPVILPNYVRDVRLHDTINK